MDEIDHAEVVEVNALRDYGGYGYRVGVTGPRKGTKGFVLRSGSALLLIQARRRWSGRSRRRRRRDRRRPGQRRLRRPVDLNLTAFRQPSFG